VRVLVVNDLPPGAGSGAEVTLLRLVEGLRRAGDDVHLFAGEVEHRGLGRVLDLWDPMARRALVRRVRTLAPDVVHHHNVLRELSVSVLGAPRGTPCVLTVHDFRLVGESDGGLRGIRHLVDRHVKKRLDLAVARRRVDVTLAVSADLARRLDLAGMPRVEVVGVPAGDPGADPPPPSSSSLVVAAGRLSPDKGLDVLLRAWSQLDVPGAGLVLAGDGPDRDRLAELARSLPGVRLVGRLSGPDTQDLLRSARVVCVPSLPSVRREGTPLAAAEAALLGRSLVVSDDPGLSDLVERLGAGAVVPAGDAAALAAALRVRLEDGALADDEGAKLRDAAAAVYSTDAVVAQVQEAYRTAVALGDRG
jgi:glycosyltransferase involved in cell wall biosynthesis